MFINIIIVVVVANHVRILLAGSVPELGRGSVWKPDPRPPWSP